MPINHKNGSFKYSTFRAGPNRTQPGFDNYHNYGTHVCGRHWSPVGMAGWRRWMGREFGKREIGAACLASRQASNLQNPLSCSDKSIDLHCNGQNTQNGGTDAMTLLFTASYWIYCNTYNKPIIHGFGTIPETGKPARAKQGRHSNEWATGFNGNSIPHCHPFDLPLQFISCPFLFLRNRQRNAART